MKKTLISVAAAGMLLAASLPINAMAAKPAFTQHFGEDFQVTQIGQYDSKVGIGGSEIMAYDEELQRAFVTNGAVSGFDILSFEKLKSGKFTKIRSEKRVFLSEFGIDHVADITSIASHPTKNLIAVSVVSDPKTAPGYIAFLDKDGEYITKVQVGSLPDMVTFTPDGTKAVVANEGEPSDDYSVDPEGSISIIDLSTEEFKVNTITFKDVLLDEKVRVNSKGTILQQLEPEYVTITDDSKTAYISLQENNAIATVDLVNEKILSVKGLGVKDHSVKGNELDGKRNDEAKLERLPLLGFYMPDAIDTFSASGKTYILTPNEGDARDYEGYSEEVEVGDIADQIKLNADHYAGFTQAELDQMTADGLLEELKKMKLTAEHGKNDDGIYEALYSYGGRSFSIFDAETMELVFDSGSEFEKITAEALPEYFNTDNDEIAFDKRSNAKGPEPETVVTGEVNGTQYAFIALERISGIMVYDLTTPAKPEFVTMVTSRDFSKDIAGDVSPEGLQFIPAEESPTGFALLAATHEVSGTVAIYEFGGKPMKGPHQFKDVGNSHWAHEYIADLYGRGIVNGKSETAFAPQESVTRVQFESMLKNVLSLTDLADSKSSEFESLFETGIVEGQFKPYTKLTREQMAAMTVRAYEFAMGEEIQVSSFKQYKDLQSANDNFKEDIQKVYALGVMVGDGEVFQPKKPSTRAQAAKVVSILLSKIEE